MNILLCLSHSIEEYDQLKLFHSLGYSVASIGGYIDPAHPHVDDRPALPEIPMVPEIKAAVDAIGSDDNLTAAQERLPEAVLDWADVIIYHHYLDRLYGQWDRIREWLRADSAHRVIWRTVGQSVDGNEFAAQRYRREGMEIIRYSPNERNIPDYAGEDALIRFYKDPDEWSGWTGDWTMTSEYRQPVLHKGPGGVPFVGNVTKQLRDRDPFTNYEFWDAATEGLARLPAGPGSERHLGLGELPYDDMRAYLRGTRAYLYTGTQPASYTLGLLEALMTGTPVVSIPARFMRVFPYGYLMFEGDTLCGSPDRRSVSDTDTLAQVRYTVAGLLGSRPLAEELSAHQRAFTIQTFGRDRIFERWDRYLKGLPLDDEPAVSLDMVLA